MILLSMIPAHSLVCTDEKRTHLNSHKGWVIFGNQAARACRLPRVAKTLGLPTLFNGNSHA